MSKIIKEDVREEYVLQDIIFWSMECAKFAQIILLHKQMDLDAIDQHVLIIKDLTRVETAWHAQSIRDTIHNKTLVPKLDAHKTKFYQQMVFATTAQNTTMLIQIKDNACKEFVPNSNS